MDKSTSESQEAPAAEGRDTNSVQVISRAAAILWTLREHPEGLSLASIAKATGLARSTVYRIVSTLEAERFVAWVGPNGRVRLGLGLATLGAAVSTDLRRELRPYLEGLSVEIDETVDLAVLDKDKVLFIDQIATPRRLQAVSSVGVTFPLHCTANGKAMLSLLSEERLEPLLPARLPAFTPKTTVTREELLLELASIRACGIAFDLEEHAEGICAIGAAFLLPSGIIAAISIPVPSIRFYGNEDRIASALKRTAESIRGFFHIL